VCGHSCQPTRRQHEESERVQAVQLCVASPIADTTTLPRRQARLNYAALESVGKSGVGIKSG